MFDETTTEMTKADKQLARLKRMVDLLEGTGPYAEVGPPVNFDIASWFELNHSADPDDHPDDDASWRMAVREGSCGTVACAIGHAACDPWFREQGLTGYFTRYSGRVDMHWGYVDREYDGPVEMKDDLQAFFGLSEREANVFYPSFYEGLGCDDVTPEIVASVLRKIIRDKEAA